MNVPDILSAIMQASGWSQELLAKELGVSFPTLNSWINGKSQPRKNAIERIEKLRASIIGVIEVDKNTLALSRQRAKAHSLTAKQVVSNKALLDKLSLHLTYHTNTIEGSTMTLSDVQDVIFDNKVLSNKTAIEQTEARNHQATLHWLLDEINAQGEEFKINEELVKSIHVRLMNGIISDAGLYRNHSVRIMGSRTTLVNWIKIPDSLNQLFVSQGGHDDSIKYLARFHAEFEKIHPFSDGNGRTGRLIMLAQALSFGIVPPLIQKERKQAYYKSLELAQMRDEVEPLEQFVAESIIYSAELLEITS